MEKFIGSFVRITCLLVFVTATVFAQVRANEFTKMEGAVLLSGWPGTALAITRGKHVEIFDREGLDLWNSYPSLSRDGNTVAFARNATRFSRPDRNVILGTYLLAKREWIQSAGPVEQVFCVALSPDGSQLAYSVFSFKPATSTIHIVRTVGGGRVLEKRLLGVVRTLSWSPSADRLVFDQMSEDYRAPDSTTSIAILTISDAKVLSLGRGGYPAWSPSGEWIAYLDQSREAKEPDGPSIMNQIRVMHSDGSGQQTLVQLGKKIWLSWSRIDRSIPFAPVWSPDSRRLLISEEADEDKQTCDIQIVEVSTGSMHRLARGKAPVYGWALAP